MVQYSPEAGAITVPISGSMTMSPPASTGACCMFHITLCASIWSRYLVLPLTGFEDATLMRKSVVYGAGSQATPAAALVRIYWYISGLFHFSRAWIVMARLIGVMSS